MCIVTPLHDLPYLSQDMMVMDMGEAYHDCIFYLYYRGICGGYVRYQCKYSDLFRSGEPCMQKIWIFGHKFA